jgi:hypothetical protein
MIKKKKDNKVRFFEKDYWLNTMNAVLLDDDSRLNVLVDMTTQFLNVFKGSNELKEKCLKQFNGQAVKIASSKIEVDIGYTIPMNWFQTALAKMVIVSDKHSTMGGNPEQTLRTLFKNYGWDFEKAMMHDEDNYFYTYRKLDFLAGVNDKEEIFDHFYLPMIPICQFGHGTKWQMKNGKIWTSHGYEESIGRVILFNEDDGYVEKRFQKHVVLKMTKLEVM